MMIWPEISGLVNEFDPSGDATKVWNHVKSSSIRI